MSQMRLTTPSTFDVVAGRRARYVSELRRSFASKLSPDDCEDAVQTALMSGWSADAATGRSVPEFEAYVRLAASRAALSQLRAMRGEGAVRRSFTAFDERLHDVPAPHLPEDELLAQSQREEYRRIVQGAYERLPASNRHALRDRYTLELPVAQCAARRNASPTQFERLFTASVARLRVLVAHSGADACMRARLELDIARAGDATGRAIAAAHIEGCLSCQTYSFASKNGLLGTLPVPAVGLLGRLLDWLPGFGHSSDAVALTSGATASTGVASGVAGTTAIGVGVKTATIGACSLVVTGACVFGGQALLDPSTANSKSSAPARTAAAPAAAAYLPAAVSAARARVPKEPAKPIARPAPKPRVTQIAQRKPRAATPTSTPTMPTQKAPAPRLVMPAAEPAPAPAPALVAPAPISAPAPVVPQAAPAPAPSSAFAEEFSP